MPVSAEGQMPPSQCVDGAQYPADLKPHVQPAPLKASPQAQQVLQPLPPGWMEMKDPEGRILYVNPVTGQSSWQRPSPPALPEGWQSVRSPDGRDMYIHIQSGAASYERPTLQQSQTHVQAAPVQASPIQAAPVQAAPVQTAPVQAVPTQAAVTQPIGNKVTRVVVQRPKIPSNSQVPSLAATQTTIRKGVPRSMTAPVTGSAALNLQVDVGGLAVQNLHRLPGVQQARMVHQISANNNARVLSKKLASDVAQTSITAASLATRQAKTVGKMLMSPKKLQKFSKKVVVQTGAMSVKAGRACKVVMNEMVETADGKGRYVQKKTQRPYVAFDVSLSQNVAVVGSTSQPPPPQPQTQVSTPTSATTLSHQASVKSDMKTGVPARKPVRKPVATTNSVSQTEVSNPAQQAAPNPPEQSMSIQVPTGMHHTEATYVSLTQSPVPGDVQVQHIQLQTSNLPTSSTAQTKIDAGANDHHSNPSSPLGPPSYQQSVHERPSLQQGLQIQPDVAPVQMSLKPSHAEQQINVDMHQVLDAVEILQSINHGKAEHNSHTAAPYQQHVQHDVMSHLQNIQLLGQQASPTQGQIGTVYQPEIVYLPSSTGQQDQLIASAIQSDPSLQNNVPVQQVDPSQMVAYQQTPIVDSSLLSATNTTLITSPQGMVYDQVTSVDTGDVTVTEEEIVYVDEDGNIISEDMLTFVDENTGEVFMYDECDINGVECEAEVADVGEIDTGGGDFDFWSIFT